MTELRREWTHDDKLAGWEGEKRPLPDGPWMDEPDKVQWVDEASDLDCLIVRGPLGALCGYVGVAKGHPAFEKEYMDVAVSVHGGLTYDGFCSEGEDEAHGICHTPFEGRTDEIWWLGFDTGHYMDLVPGMIDLVPSMGGTYKPISYVTAEVTQLAAQLGAMA